MALQMQDTGEFKLVTHRKKRVFSVRNSCDPNVILLDDNDDSNTDTDYEALFGKLLEAETELRNSLFGDDVFHYLQDSLRALDVDGISEILCYGLVIAANFIKATTCEPVDYILRIQPYVTETVLRNNFMYEDVFNDLNIHIFLKHNIDMVPRNFWNEREEPCYRGATFDYFTAKQTERIEAKNCRKNDET
ncbi:uncharacterized protein LOC122394788 isoform X2 [Colletes gigas]|uniref:uncharacterized protein LOC122394788 isoform X2 n=1 Tax=Colletes gigas TaxID=935657 RepID=UPI001C9BA6C1|nr:uncharacterized protein LOC122394788 isoform X2 [Colletes gigas]